LPYRSIQVGLSKAAVDIYINKWIQKITDITDVAHAMHEHLSASKSDLALALLPQEKIYPHAGLVT